MSSYLNRLAKIYILLYFMDNFRSILRSFSCYMNRDSRNTKFIQILRDRKSHKLAALTILSIVLNRVSHNFLRRIGIKREASIVSGMIAGLSFMGLEYNKRIDLLLTLVVRSVDALMLEHMQNVTKKPNILRNFYAQYSTIIFVFSAREIMYDWFYNPGALPKSYQFWISQMADIPDDLIKALRLFKAKKIQYGKKNDVDEAKVLSRLCLRQGISPQDALPENGFFMCSNVVHPRRNCLENSAYRFMNGFFKSLQVGSISN